FMAWVVVTLPPAAGWVHQEAYIIVFGQTPRIVVASLLAFFSGEFVNSYVLEKMKIFTTGKFLWIRTIGSTVAGEAMDSIIFYPIAFYGFWPNDLLITVMLTNYVLKVSWEVVATPLTYKVVGFLKRKEHEDYYDRNTNFTPFSIEV
ncbi:MAG: queuosine precursor transporter, partial [Ignavibacteriaceae bacterium]